MSRSMWTSVLTTVLFSALFAAQIEGYCSKCVKIEEEREKEQAAHPQVWDYYDDVKKNQNEDQNSSSNTKQQPIQIPQKTNS